MSVRFDTTGAVRQLTETQQRTLYACLTYGRAAATQLVKEAVIHRPWEDRTHLAKNSLNGGAYLTDSGRVRVELAHGVYYGVYLEKVRFRHKGSLAIVFPTMRKMSTGIINGWAQVVKRGGG
ncbi:MAG: hypothetical protein ACI4MK_01285 [Aristaeellaceae bacterium]